MRIGDWSSDVSASDLSHPNRHSGNDNLGYWRVDHPIAPERVEEAACIAEQADPDILAIEDHTIFALHFFMKRFVDRMDEAPLSHWRTYPQKHGRQGEEDHSKHR